MNTQTQTPQQIKTFWLVVDYSCNNRCHGCYASESKFVHNPIELDYAFKVIDIMAQVKATDCLLIGGEPTLYENLPQLIEYGSKLGIGFKLVTNGRKLANKKYLQILIKAGLVHASISVEGYREQTHNSITGSKSYKQTMQAISNCIEIGLSFNTLLTINQHNQKEIMPLAVLLHAMGVKNILYNIGLPSCGEQAEVETYCLHPLETAKYIAQAYEVLKSKNIKAKFLATIPLCLFEENLLDNMIKNDYISNGSHCHIFYGSGIVFEPNGNVLPCTHFVSNPLFNMNKEHIETVEDFMSIWYGESGIHGNFKNAVWQYPHEACVECKHWGKCIGGCPFLWTKYDPNNLIPRKEVKLGSDNNYSVA